jgi:hypothetical protein
MERSVGCSTAILGAGNAETRKQAGRLEALELEWKGGGCGGYMHVAT